MLQTIKRQTIVYKSAAKVESPNRRRRGRMQPRGNRARHRSFGAVVLSPNSMGRFSAPDAWMEAGHRVPPAGPVAGLPAAGLLLTDNGAFLRAVRSRAAPTAERGGYCTANDNVRRNAALAWKQLVGWALPTMNSVMGNAHPTRPQPQDLALTKPTSSRAIAYPTPT